MFHHFKVLTGSVLTGLGPASMSILAIVFCSFALDEARAMEVCAVDCAAVQKVADPQNHDGLGDGANQNHNQSVHQAILAVLSDQEAAWNEGDIDRFMSGYWRSDQLRFASGNTIVYGWQATLDRYVDTYPDRSAMGRLDFTILDVNVFSERSAVVFGRFRLFRELDEPNGLFTLVFEKIDDQWLIISDHTSANN